MALTVKQLLHTAAYLPEEIERLLNPARPSFLEFDPVLGYQMKNHKFADGLDGAVSTYTFEPHGGHRKLHHYADQPCRINTYGDSFTQCSQVSDGETWQEVLAAHIREPVRNFGVGGYGVYQAYRRAMRVEATDIAAEYQIINVWDDDNLRNIDAARWIRVGWMCRDLPRGGGEDKYPVHGFPWAHLRYDLDKGQFVERPGLFEQAQDLRRLVGRDAYYETFKDDPVAHLYVLTQGGEAPVAEQERLAEAFGLTVDLRDPATRTRDARRLHWTYGVRSTQHILDLWRAWAERNGRKLMVLLSHDVPSVMGYLERGERPDQELVDYCEAHQVPYVDLLARIAAEHQAYNLSIEDFLGRFYIPRAGAQVFGHYSPPGCFWFAFAIREAVVKWLDPKPPAYGDEAPRL